MLLKACAVHPHTLEVLMLSLHRVYCCGKTIRYRSPLGFTEAETTGGKIIAVITKSSNFHSVFRDLLSLGSVWQHISGYVGLQSLIYTCHSGGETLLQQVRLPLIWREGGEQEETCWVLPGKPPTLKNSPESESRGMVEM